MLLKDKTALITGASRGIGQAIAVAFAKEGADIAIVYVGPDNAADETIALVQQAGRRAIAYNCDVSDFAATKETVEKAIGDFGGVDILVNNAGITRDALMLQMKEEDYDAVLATNLKGAFNMTRHLYTHFMRKRYGRIVNMSSVVGLMGNAGQANYAAAKAGLFGLTKTTAKELAARGVTCNAIAPGFIKSDMTDAMPEKAREAMMAAVPAKRPGEVQDVANLALFLASDMASYITGQTVCVDGGLAMGG